MCRLETCEQNDGIDVEEHCAWSLLASSCLFVSARRVTVETLAGCYMSILEALAPSEIKSQLLATTQQFVGRLRPDRNFGTLFDRKHTATCADGMCLNWLACYSIFCSGTTRSTRCCLFNRHAWWTSWCLFIEKIRGPFGVVLLFLSLRGCQNSVCCKLLCLSVPRYGVFALWRVK